jgi:hypothetical protein
MITKTRIFGMLAALPFIVLTIQGCRRTDGFASIRSGDLTMVMKGTYPGTPNLPDPAGRYETLANTLRSEIEKNQDLFPKITERYFPLTNLLDYRFKYISIDESNECLVFRYFARLIGHPLYAGYQIQFVFDLKKGNLKQLYIAEVPLE